MRGPLVSSDSSHRHQPRISLYGGKFTNRYPKLFRREKEEEKQPTILTVPSQELEQKVSLATKFQ